MQTDLLDTSLEAVKAGLLKLQSSSAFVKLQEYYSEKTFWEVLDVEHKENYHSRFLAWLLSPYEFHKLGAFPIEALIKTAASVIVMNGSNQTVELSEDIHNFMSDVMSGNCRLQNINVTTEKFTEDTSNGRLDVFITAQAVQNDNVRPFFCIIENKINSNENSEQTRKYSQWLDRQCENIQNPI